MDWVVLGRLRFELTELTDSSGNLSREKWECTTLPEVIGHDAISSRGVSLKLVVRRDNGLFRATTFTSHVAKHTLSNHWAFEPEQCTLMSEAVSDSFAEAVVAVVEYAAVDTRERVGGCQHRNARILWGAVWRHLDSVHKPVPLQELQSFTLGGMEWVRVEPRKWSAHYRPKHISIREPGVLGNLSLVWDITCEKWMYYTPLGDCVASDDPYDVVWRAARALRDYSLRMLADDRANLAGLVKYKRKCLRKLRAVKQDIANQEQTVAQAEAKYRQLHDIVHVFEAELFEEV